MKQNLPTLEKRREQWINWSVEKKQIEEETAQSEEALRNTVASLTAQKKSAETLEKDIEALTEQIKRFQKERDVYKRQLWLMLRQTKISRASWKTTTRSV